MCLPIFCQKGVNRLSHQQERKKEKDKKSAMNLHVFGPVLLALLCSPRVLPGSQALDDQQRHLFTTFPNLMKLYYMEEECLSNVDVFLREELAEHGSDQAAVEVHHHNLTSVRKLVEKAKKTHAEVGSNVKEYLAHPVNVFHLVQRLHDGWKDAIELIRQSKPCREWHLPLLLSRLANLEANLPTDEEFHFIISNLLTIQHTQAIPTKQLVEGKVRSHVSLSPITPHEQFRIARSAVEDDDYFYAAQWLKHLSKYEGLNQMTKAEDGFNATNVLGMLSSAYYRINMVPEALKAIETLLQKEPENMVALNNKAFYEERLSRGDNKARPPRSRYVGAEDRFRRQYESLCRAARTKTKRLKCYLEPTWPGSRFSFYKFELLNRKPPIVAYHDVISRKDADQIIDIAEDEYEKDAMDSDEGYKTPQFTLVLSDVATTRQMGARALAIFQRLLTRVKRSLMALPAAAMPPFILGESEVRNYGHQGFYFKPPPDFQVHTLGANTATAMVFLNDVEMGGEIVFPGSNTRVAPQQGSVVVYFPSMKKLHAICPVAFGTEWLLIHSFFEKRAPTFCRAHEDPELVE